MRLVFYIGAMAAGVFTLVRLPRLPKAIHDLLSGGDYEKILAVGFVSLTVLTAVLTYLCMKKTFPPPKPK